MKRLTQLDGVRGIAILLVLVWHYIYCQASPEPGSVLWYCMRAISLTWSGVDLFFVLSGFLIAGILLDHRDTSNYFRVFYLRRICRIFPLYFLLLGLFVCVAATSVSAAPRFRWVFANPIPIWSYATFTQNIVMGIRGNFGNNWLGITWSLAVEEQFYLVLPLLIYLLPRRSALLSSFLVAVLVAPILRYLSPGFHAIVGMPWRADSLLSGASLALLVRWHPFLPAVRRARRLLLAIFITLLLGTVAMTNTAAERWLWMGATFGHFWLACLYSAFILVAFADTEPHLGRLLRSRVLVWFGNRSYAIYMFHQAASGVLHGLFRSGPPEIRTPSDAWITLLSLCTTLLLALLSYRFVEGPILRLGHRARYSPQPGSVSPADRAKTARRIVWGVATAFLIVSAGVLWKVQSSWRDNEALLAALARARLKYNHGDLAGAAREFKAALELDPQSVALYDLGVVDSRLGHLKEAAAEEEEGLKHFADPPAKAYAELAKIYDLNGDQAKSEAALKQAELLHNGAHVAALARAQLKYNHGDLAGAEAILRNLTAADPSDPHGWTVLGMTAIRENNHAQALEDFRQATALAPSDPFARVMEGLALHQLGRDQEALEQCRHALAIAPNDPDAQALIARIQRELERK